MAEVHKVLKVLNKKFPDANAIIAHADLFEVKVGDEYFEEVHTFKLAGTKLVHVSTLTFDAS